MILDDALVNIAQQFGFDAQELVAYSYEDNISGWDQGVGGWPVGSLWTVEGRVLYALVRALQPELVVEIGTNVGCGAAHIASALKANGKGKVKTFDTSQVIVIPPDAMGISKTYQQGELIPHDLWDYVDLIHADGVAYVELDMDHAGLIYEDGTHDGECTRRVWKAGGEKLTPGGVLVSHDAAHFLVGQTIRDGITAAGYDPAIYPIQPSDCGLAIWRKPVVITQPEPEIPERLRPFIPADEPEVEPLFHQPDFVAMSIADLKAYAEDYGYDLGDAKRKADIIAILEANT